MPGEPGASMADALLAPGTTKAGAGEQEPKTPAAVQHPFPMAQSAGLEPEQPAGAAEAAPPPPPGSPQITDALSYRSGMKDPDDLSGDAAKPTTVTAAAAGPESPEAMAAKGRLAAAPMPAAPAAPVVTPKPAAQPPVNDVVHIVGRMFRKLFGR